MNNYSLRKSIVLAVLLISLSGTATYAQDPSSALTQYDVELLVFKNLGATGTAENWALEEELAKQRGVIPEDDEGVGASQTSQPKPSMEVAFTPLTPAQFKLTAIEDSLRRSRSYQPLAHIGWTQAGYALQGAPFIPIAGLLAAGTPLNGQVALSRGHYLHLTLDLVYQSSASPQPYVLRQSRRMKSGERHYFDHPTFGVIAIITPHLQG